MNTATSPSLPQSKQARILVVDYVTKSFNPPELLARVLTHIELRQARERLREMNNEKNEFMGMAAHDLRNLLGVIKGYAEIVLKTRTLSFQRQPNSSNAAGPRFNHARRRSGERPNGWRRCSKICSTPMALRGASSSWRWLRPSCRASGRHPNSSSLPDSRPRRMLQF